MEANVLYPDVRNPEVGAVEPETIRHDPHDRKFHCIYCPHAHKDVESIKVPTLHYCATKQLLTLLS
jgi:hypothetical protein